MKRQPVPQGEGKKAAQGKHQQRERTEPTRGLSKDEKVSPADPVNEPMTGTLEHRASRSAYRLVIKEETRDGGTGKGAPRRRRTSRETRNEYVLRGPRLAVGLLGTLFFWPVPCALEALTVINLLVEIVHSHA